MRAELAEALDRREGEGLGDALRALVDLGAVAAELRSELAGLPRAEGMGSVTPREARERTKKLKKELERCAAAAEKGLSHHRFGDPDLGRRLWTQAAEVLGGMRRYGAPHLWKAVDARRFRRVEGFRGELLLRLGQTQDHDFIDELLDCVADEDAALAIPALRALRSYQALPGKLRRRIVEGVTEAYDSTDRLMQGVGLRG